MTFSAETDPAASAGSRESQFELALQLLSREPPSPDDVRRGVALLEASATAGHPEAAERCALLEAMGAGRLQNWDRSLDYLQLAAERGSSRAQAQLLLLADPTREPDLPVDAPSGFWLGVRGKIAIDRLLDPGERTILSEGPRIRAIKGFASSAECNWLIGLAGGKLGPATVFDEASGKQVQDPVRDNRSVILRLAAMDVVTEVIRGRIAAATKMPVAVFEPAQVMQYSVGQRFKAHHDYLDPANPAYRDDLSRFGQRIATFLVYLNQDYEGGETSFPAIGLDYRGETGEALFFANVDRSGNPDRNTLHAGLPPTSGEKWLLSQWIRDRTAAA